MSNAIYFACAWFSIVLGAFLIVHFNRRTKRLQGLPIVESKHHRVLVRFVLAVYAVTTVAVAS